MADQNPGQVSATAPAAPTPPPAAPPAPAAPVTPAKTIATLDAVDDIDAALSQSYALNPNEKVPLPGEKPPEPAPTPAAVTAPPVPAPPVPAPAAPAPVTEPPAPAKAPEEPARDDQGKILPRHIPTKQFSTVEQRAIVLLQQLNEGKQPDSPDYVPLEECIAIAKKAEGQPVQPQPTVDPVAEVSAVVTAKQTAVDEIQARITEYKASPDLYTDELEAAKTELFDAKLDLRDAQRDERDARANAQNQQLNSVKQAKQAAIVTAQSRYPTLAVQGSELRERANALTRAMLDPSHPDHMLTQIPSGPTRIADQAATDLAHAQSAASGGTLSFAQALANLMVAAAAPAQPQQQEEPRRVLPSPGSSGTPNVVAKTIDQKVAEVGDNVAEIDKLLDGGGEGAYVIR